MAVAILTWAARKSADPKYLETAQTWEEMAKRQDFKSLLIVDHESSRETSRWTSVERKRKFCVKSPRGYVYGWSATIEGALKMARKIESGRE